MSEQRKDRRAPALLRVKYKSATVDQFVSQFGTDISRGGIFIRTKSPLKLGSPLKLQLQLQDASNVIHGVGRVTWRREPGAEGGGSPGMGIKFIKLDPDSRALVERVVQQRAGAGSRYDDTTGAEREPQGASEPPASLAPAPGVGTPRSPVPPARTSVGVRPPTAGLFSDTTRSSRPPRKDAGRTSFFPDTASARPASRQSDQVRHSSQFLATALSEGGAAEGTTAEARAEAERAQRADAPNELEGIDDLLDAAFDELAGAAGAPAARPPSAAPVARPPSAAPAARSRSAAPAPSPAPPAPPAGPPAVPAPRPVSAPLPKPPDTGESVDDIFASLSDDLAATSSDAPSAPEPGLGVTGAASTDDESIDDLFASLNDADVAPPARDAVEDSVEDVFASLNEESGAALPVGAMLAEELEADGTSAFDEVDEDEETTDFALEGDEEFGEFDLAGPASLPAPMAQSEATRGAPVALIAAAAVVLLAAGAAAWHFLGGGLPGMARTDASSATATGETEAEAPSAPEGTAPGAQAPPAEGDGKAAPAPTGEMVRVNFTSLPRGADLWIGGKKVGATPTTLELAGGVPVNVTVSSTGFRSMSREVMPMEGIVPQRFKLEPLPFRLIIETEPLGAEVTVNGKTAVSPEALDLGHINGVISVSVALEGYRRMTRPVRLDEFTQEGDLMVAHVPVKLSPLPGTVVPAWQRALGREPKRKARAKRKARTQAKAADDAPPAPEPSADPEPNADEEAPPKPEPAAEKEPPPAPEAPPVPEGP